jgi:hypothetical protein
MKIALTAAVVLTLLAGATPASAEHRMTFEYASAVAVDYWTDHGFAVPCQPTLSFMSEAESDHANDVYGGQVDMLTDPASCSIDISVTAEAYRTDRDLDWLYCEDIVHEFGHLAGLDDDAGGIMDSESNVVPFGCAHQRQWMVMQGWRKPPRWIRHSPQHVQRLWLAGHGYAARTAQQRLQAQRHKHHAQTL